MDARARLLAILLLPALPLFAAAPAAVKEAAPAEKAKAVEREYESLLRLPLERRNRVESIRQSETGLDHLDKRHYDDAYLCFRRSIEADPTSAEAYKNMGFLLRTQEETKYRYRFYERAVALQPNDNVVRFFLAEAYAVAGLYLEAMNQAKLLEAAGEKLSEEKWYAEAQKGLRKSGGRREARAAGSEDLVGGDESDDETPVRRRGRVSPFQTWTLATMCLGAAAAGTGFTIDYLAYEEYTATDDHDTTVRMHERCDYSRILAYAGSGVGGLGAILFLVATSTRGDSYSAEADETEEGAQLRVVPDPSRPSIAFVARF